MGAPLLIQGQQRVAFSPIDTGPALRLELDNKFGLAPPGTIPVRLYPPVAADTDASVGEAMLSSQMGVNIRAREFVRFSGTATASPRYPITGTPQIMIRRPPKTLRDGRFVLASIGPSSIQYDALNDQLIAPQPLYGGIIISYISAYRLIHYTPGRTVFSVGTQQGITVETGTVYAFHQGQDAELEIPLARDTASTSAILCQVFSRVIASNGELEDLYEMPPEWPENDRYPNLPNAETPDPNNSIDQNRIHETWFYNGIGSVSRQTGAAYKHRFYKPYFGHTSYRPKAGGRFASQADHEDMEDAYARAIQRKDELIKGMQKRYSNWAGEW